MDPCTNASIRARYARWQPKRVMQLNSARGQAMRTLMRLAMIVALLAACTGGPAREDATRAEPAWLTDRPANAYPYADETLVRFRRLLTGEDWRDATRNAQGTLEASHAKSGLKFVLIPAGSYLMGSPANEADRDDDEAQHQVTLGPFLLCKTEGTQAGWDGIGGEDERRSAGADRPIEGVSWHEVSAWCGKAGLRLPSEAEWEYACRAGTTTPYWSGDAEEDLARLFVSSRGMPHGVGQKPANPFGLFGVHGNAWEWCEDEYRHSPAGEPDDGTARVRQGIAGRVFRGGSWDLFAQGARSAQRDLTRPGFRGFFLGFRPAADLWQ